jgi:hypothetical protein
VQIVIGEGRQVEIGAKAAGFQENSGSSRLFPALHAKLAAVWRQAYESPAKGRIISALRQRDSLFVR